MPPKKVLSSQDGDIGNKIFYFDTEDPTHPALFGEVTFNGGRHHWFDENQVWLQIAG